MPSQFQLRDIVNHVVVGSVVLFLFLLFVFVFYPPLWDTAVCEWHLLKGELGDGLILPLLLTFIYVIGNLTTSSRKAKVYGTPDNWRSEVLTKPLTLFSDPKDLRMDQSALIKQLFIKRSQEQFGIREGDISKPEEQAVKASCHDLKEEYPDLFDLALAHVLNKNESLRQFDIERHYVLTRFHSKLAILFELASAVSLIGSGLSFLAKVSSIRTAMVSWYVFLSLAVLFYVAARFARAKSEGNYQHWKDLVIRSFITISGDATLHKQR